jgi:hypothetical protein
LQSARLVAAVAELCPLGGMTSFFMIHSKSMMTAFVVLICVAASDAAETNGLASNSIATNPMLAIYRTQPKLGNAVIEPQFIIAVWEDGRIIWASGGPHPNPRLRRTPRSLEFAQTRGGLPYQEGGIPKEKLDEMLCTLEKQRVFSDEALAREIYRRRPGPDTWCTTILINRGGKKWEMQSPHEHFEENTNTVFTAAYPEALDGRIKEAVLKQQPMIYQNFRKTWSDIRKAFAGLIPDKGEPFNGKIQVETK